MAEKEKQLDRELQTIIVPWRLDCSLLLANEVVAEVIYHLDFKPVDKKTDWIQGEVEWQNQLLPLISFDAADGISETVTDEKRRVLICRTLSFSEQYPFIAIDFYRLPRHLVVKESSIKVLEEAKDSATSPFVAKISINETDAYVLDIEKLCQLL